MAPNIVPVADGIPDSRVKKKEFKRKIVWKNCLIFIFLHGGTLYGLYRGIAVGRWQSWVFAIFISLLSGLGVTAGAHRLWSHKAYKANLPLRFLLAIYNCLACQNCIYEWCRDHRVHHKYSETDADPHNVNRGFFFAHIGWLMCKKHPDVIEKGKAIDMSDLWADPVVRWQKKFYIPLVLIIAFVMPTLIPYYCWHQNFWDCFWGTTIARYTISLHFTWFVNSAAHTFGYRPYDKKISARENQWVALTALGEGFHNYHHTFPWDYSTSELGYKYNLSTIFIDSMARIGWAYDLKKVTPKMMLERIERTGDKEEHEFYHPEFYHGSINNNNEE